MRQRHPKKEVERALREAEAAGWRIQLSKGHAWGKMLCPLRARDGCVAAIWSTPASVENHARDLRRELRRCAHGGGS